MEQKKASVCLICSSMERPLAQCNHLQTPSAQSETDPLIGTTLGERYRIEALIGSGGWSRVYRAQQIDLQRPVAVKVLNKQVHAETTAVARFRQEVKALAKLEHPNLCVVHDFGQMPDGQPFYVMELLSGDSIWTLVERNGPLAPQLVREIFHQACLALAAAHHAGVVHRDISPGNIMVLGAQSDHPKVKVVDFGLAKVLDEQPEERGRLTSTGQAVGTPAYMSPEQCRAAPLDGRSDIYSLGCVMFFALTGKEPFAAENFFECMKLHVETTAPPVSSFLNTQAVAEFDGVVARALEIDPEDRFQTAEQMSAALHDPKKYVAKPRQRTTTWANRAPYLVIGALIASVAAIGIWKFGSHDATAPVTTPSAIPAHQPTANDIRVRREMAKFHQPKMMIINDLTDYGLENFSKYQSLTTVILRDCYLTDQSLIQLSQLHHLTALKLANCELNDGSLAILARNAGITALSVPANRGITNNGLTNLAPLKRLRTIEIDNTSVTDLSKLVELTDLLLISATSLHLQPGSIPPLTRLPYLQMLKLEACTGITLQDLRALQACPSLTQIRLGGVPLDNECVAAIGGMRKLKSLGVPNCNLQNDGMVALKSLPLEILDLTGNRIDDSVFQNVIASMTHLTHLFLYRTNLTDEGVAALSSLSQLKTLIIDQTQVTDKGFGVIGKMRSLEVLGARGLPQITDRGVDNLSSLVNLKRLLLDESSVSDASMAKVASFNRLETLSLRKTRVTGKGVMQLIKGAPLLKSLYIGHIMTPEQVREFASNKPACKLIYPEQGTAQEKYPNPSDWDPIRIRLFP